MKRVAAAPFRVGQQQQQQQQHKKKKKRGREICEGQPKFLSSSAVNHRRPSVRRRQPFFEKRNNFLFHF
jgi:hypothetical protein